MRKPLARLLLLAALVQGAGVAGAEGTAASDPRAAAIADRVMEALGGKQRWDDLPGLRWTFGSMVHDTVRGTRYHAWNKHTGWHRVGYRTTAGDSFVIIHRVGTPEGRAWANGHPIEGDSLEKLIARGMRVWTNDTYWLLMPYKLRDAGVRLVWDSEKVRDGKTCDVLALSFDQVGQTPGDRYWVYVNRENHRVESWDMVLQGDSPPAVTYSWADWVNRGGLWFATAHRREGRNVFTRDVEAVRVFRPAEFTAP